MLRRSLLAAPALAALAADDRAAISTLLEQQAADWNRGDIPAFMRGYWRSPQLTFIGKDMAQGFDATMERYRLVYGTKEKMGQLRFELLRIELLGKDHASVIGRFFLTRKAEGGGDASGIFNLILRRFGGRKEEQGWKIILDHTS
jgi:ketosteroid isomerase-like protein